MPGDRISFNGDFRFKSLRQIKTHACAYISAQSKVDLMLPLLRMASFPYAICKITFLLLSHLAALRLLLHWQPEARGRRGVGLSRFLAIFYIPASC